MSDSGSGSGFTCSQCFSAGMTEQQALNHECWVIPPEPEMAEPPMSTREAVAVLANQIANLTEAIDRMTNGMREAVEEIMTFRSDYNHYEGMKR